MSAATLLTPGIASINGAIPDAVQVAITRLSIETCDPTPALAKLRGLTSDRSTVIAMRGRLMLTVTGYDGVRLGAALRQAYHATETGQQALDPNTGRARPRAHVRRAHWHTFLAGAARSERRLKWLPPIPVNLAGDDPGALPAVVRKVD
ncbi:MAG: hypothetical protein F9K47_14970 [Burkholderiales bacterium]|nr:MAG: hypothetical protein F9K47_14970 [Burkholderiales bacterium]